jgi:demethylmenaquinone methyltransferase/2-methoxy-6-polyprenyl-1,4-benzoquinol methylase
VASAAAADGGEVSAEVRRMFASIARRYDAANQVLSLGVHHGWRRAAVRLSGVRAGDRVLDCATGTGDLALEFRRAGARVVGADFCLEMMQAAREKSAFVAADALLLPFHDAQFDVASIAFGIRNVDDPLRCLREMARVVKHFGRVVVLEFGQPRGAFGALFHAYSRGVMPLVGGALTGNRAAYEYLRRTAAAFPAGERFLAFMSEAACFSSAEATPLTLGTAFVYVGTVQ